MCVDVQTSSLNGLQTKEYGSSGDEIAPKVSTRCNYVSNDPSFSREFWSLFSLFPLTFH